MEKLNARISQLRGYIKSNDAAYKDARTHGDTASMAEIAEDTKEWKRKLSLMQGTRVRALSMGFGE